MAIRAALQMNPKKKEVTSGNRGQSLMQKTDVLHNRKLLYPQYGRHGVTHADHLLICTRLLDHHR